MAGDIFGPGRSADTDHIAERVRRRFSLKEDRAVLVAELRCALANCPPLETALAFWDDSDTRYQFKILKPLAEVRETDIAWLIGDLKDQDTNYWDCC
jgi:hypothetical protein